MNMHKTLLTVVTAEDPIKAALAALVDIVLNGHDPDTISKMYCVLKAAQENILDNAGMSTEPKPKRREQLQ